MAEFAVLTALALGVADMALSSQLRPDSGGVGVDVLDTAGGRAARSITPGVMSRTRGTGG
ncbi:hypothetical protein GCM10010353_46270 [Streptomyces chryseus]|uniref:Uncharacterized protein n=1 Tax=Streptomyces chryseus TaxID=68186 RepID=A0ABQ3DRG8_9ACTN|nr:hypothetical protein GCM10010353_46270 [Streptomyces chryseus]GHB05662.1 hypothetical protein GCM10010346_30980 [Streptomyces chryseus]